MGSKKFFRLCLVSVQTNSNNDEAVVPLRNVLGILQHMVQRGACSFSETPTWRKRA